MAEVQIEQGVPAGTVSPRQRFRVEVRTAWDDGEWEDVPYLYVRAAELAAAPGVSRAEFVYDFGNVTREDQETAEFAACPPLELMGRFVRVVKLGVAEGGTAEEADPIWYGVIESDGLELLGTQSDSQTAIGGRQVMTAYGLEHLLDRFAVRGSWVLRKDTFFVPRLIRRDWSPAFNERVRVGLGGRALGNRSAIRETPVGQGTSYMFGADGNTWSDFDIAEYLIAQFVPLSLKVKLGGQVDLLNVTVTPRFAVHESETVWSVLNRLIDRRRGMGWCVRVDDQMNVVVHVFAVFGEDVSFGGTTGGQTTVAKNTEPVVVVLDERRDVAAVSLEDAGHVLYDEIFVRGNRVVSCFTVSVADGNVQAGWESVLEGIYKSPGGANAEEIDARRSSTDGLSHVFQRFLVKPGFDWRPSNGEANGGQNVTVPQFNDDGSFNAAVQHPGGLNDWDVGVMRHLPMSAGSGVDEPSDPDLRPCPLVVYPDPFHVGWWHRFETGPGDLVSGSVRPLDAGFGYEVQCSPAHLLAGADWAGAAASDTLPVLHWQALIATIAVETDVRLGVRAEIDKPYLTAEEQAGRVKRVLHIDVPDAEFWWIASTTVVDVDGGVLVRFPTPGASTLPGMPVNVRRNDVERLKRIAALATAWHGRKRQVLRMELKGVSLDLRPGMYVKQVTHQLGRNIVGTVVSRVSWDFERFTTGVETGYSELQFASIR